MKQKQVSEIYMQSWLKEAGHTRIEAADNWYLDLANRLYRLLDELSRYSDRSADFLSSTAIRLSLYLHDAIHQKGGWITFITRCHELYGSYLPFYHLDNTYYPDEINTQDIALILWMQENQPGQLQVGNPLDRELSDVAARIYELLDSVFEEAPIPDIPSTSWVMPESQLTVERTQIPSFEPGMQVSTNVALFMEATRGHQLAYFADPLELQNFFEKHLKWPTAKASSLVEDDVRNIVAFANPKGLLLAPDIATCLAAEDNPFYDRSVATSIGYQLFTVKGACPFDLLKYALEQDLLKDVRLPFEGGHELLFDNWDFVARWYLGDYYEGR